MVRNTIVSTPDPPGPVPGYHSRRRPDGAFNPIGRRNHEHGTAHEPTTDAPPRGVVLLTHGFLGYKDYGMFPYLARSFADAGFVAHRYNLAHSGMTNNIETFERPDLFERDTWNHQVADIEAVMHAVDRGELAGTGRPIILWGHSRGGVSVLLTAGRRFRDGRAPLPAGVITVSAPDSINRMESEVREAMLRDGYIEIKSNRTGQTLRLGRRWLDEQINDPVNHDLLPLTRRIRCPVLALHGEVDPTVPAECAKHVADAAREDEGEAESHVISGADHVFNTPNPMPPDEPPSPQLQELVRRCIAFAEQCVA